MKNETIHGHMLQYYLSRRSIYLVPLHHSFIPLTMVLVIMKFAGKLPVMDPSEETKASKVAEAVWIKHTKIILSFYFLHSCRLSNVHFTASSWGQLGASNQFSFNKISNSMATIFVAKRKSCQTDIGLNNPLCSQLQDSSP